MERARDAVRAMKKEGRLPKGGVTVWLRGPPQPPDRLPLYFWPPEPLEIGRGKLHQAIMRSAAGKAKRVSQVHGVHRVPGRCLFSLLVFNDLGHYYRRGWLASTDAPNDEQPHDDR